MSFAAKYPGACDACGDRIEPGDLVMFLGDALVHVECRPAASDPFGYQPPPPPLDVCPRCFQQRSAAGTCGCEEGL